MSNSILEDSAPDVCIVGSGPAGLAAAHTLGSASRRIVLLESGAAMSSRNARDLNDGDHEGVAYNGLAQTRHRQIGGTPNIWNVRVDGEIGAKYVPLAATDLAQWPLDWSDLHPHYVAAQALCGLGPFEYGADHWANARRKPFDLGGTGLENGVYQFGRARRFTRELVKELRASDFVTIVPSATVTRLVMAPGGRVRGLRVADQRGRFRELAPRAVILACGAVENARLLMLAGVERNARLDWVGRGFMEHARDFSLSLAPTHPELFDAAAFYDLQRAEDGTLIGGRISPCAQALHAFGLPNAGLTLVPRARPGGPLIRRALRFMRRVAGGGQPGRYGWSRVRSPSAAFSAFDIVLNVEQRPDASNRVELGSRTDRFGNALPLLRLGWTEHEQARLDKLKSLLDEWFRAAKLGRLDSTPNARPDLNAHHHAGTTRMGTGRDDGVVDHECRVFGLDNLYIAGASVFPTAGFANPTLTIVALALRLAQTVDTALGTRG